MEMKKIFLFGLITLLSLLVACGANNSEEEVVANGDGSEQVVTLEAANWEFDKQEYTASAGNVTIELKNKEGYHGITIDGTKVKIDGEGKATVNLEAGEYIIRCSIPCGTGHTEMTAKLIVS
jgi:cytochrome c oxidase subunit II